MIENLVKMYENGAVTGYQVMVDSLHRLDPRNPGLVLGRLPDKILEEVMDYAKRYDPHRPHAASPILPAESQVRSAERWIQDHRLSRVGPDRTDGPHARGKAVEGDAMDAEPWYSARCIFRHRASGTRPTCYEERVVLLRASGFDDAMRRAEAEAREYAGSLENTEYVGCLDAYHLYIESVGDGTEVFSLIRESELRPQEYVSRFFQTGSERALTVKAEELA